MSILTIKTRPHAALKLNQIVIQDIQNKMAHHYTKNKMAQTIKQVLRRMDVVLDTQQENSLLILCPEVDEPGAITLMSHVQNELEKKLGIQVMCSSATFPSDGITFSALLDSANQKFKGEQADETESLAKQPAKS